MDGFIRLMSLYFAPHTHQKKNTYIHIFFAAPLDALQIWVMTQRPLLFCYISLTIKGWDLRGRYANVCGGDGGGGGNLPGFMKASLAMIYLGRDEPVLHYTSPPLVFFHRVSLWRENKKHSYFGCFSVVIHSLFPFVLSASED